jgi:hypothetical protein
MAGGRHVPDSSFPNADRIAARLFLFSGLSKYLYLLRMKTGDRSGFLSSF